LFGLFVLGTAPLLCSALYCFVLPMLRLLPLRKSRVIIMRPKCACNLNSDPQQRGTSCSFSSFCHFPSSCSQIVPTPRGKCQGATRHIQSHIYGQVKMPRPKHSDPHTKPGDNTMLLGAGIEIRSYHKTGHFWLGPWPKSQKAGSRR